MGAAALAALLVAPACSSSGSDNAGSKATTTAVGDTATTDTIAGLSSTTLPSTTPKPFTGSLEDFYKAPKPLPKGRPGEIIRMQQQAADTASVTLRIMYHSIDETGRDRAVTGLVEYPTAKAPKDGWPVVSWAHGTTGLSTACAPSRYGNYGPTFGIEGVHVASDYIGLGPIGERHSYLDGTDEAHSVIDAVRAARQLEPLTHAGKVWVAAGHSQGGHSALWTNQLGPTYAPELDLRGTASIAPASMLTHTYGQSDHVIPRMVGLMMLYGGVTNHPDIHPHDYVGKKVASADSVIDTGCLNDIINKIVGTPEAEFYAVDPLKAPKTLELVKANDTGTVKSSSPLLVAYGTSDSWVVPPRVHALWDRLCKVGQVTDILPVPGATHDTVVGKGGADIGAWLDSRLHGSPVEDGCPDGFR
jgi:hypothetical protein